MSSVKLIELRTLFETKLNDHGKIHLNFSTSVTLIKLLDQIIASVSQLEGHQPLPPPVRTHPDAPSQNVIPFKHPAKRKDI